MANEIKTRILLPIGTAEELQNKYESKQLSAGELLVVKTIEETFELSAGLSAGIGGKLQINSNDVKVDLSTLTDKLSELEARISALEQRS